MMIRLKLTTPAGESSLFEHPGPVIRLGRDPECELSLQGEAGTAASRQHARIDLDPNGARLTDLGSSNHTLHNDRLVEAPVTLRPGDRIQIGFTGSILVVLDLDLTPNLRLRPGESNRSLLLVGGGVAAAALLVLLVAGALLWRGREPRVADDAGQVPSSTSTPVQVAGSPALTSPGKEKNAQNPPAGNSPRHPVAALESINLDVKKVGYYLRRPGVRTSVLLQRSAENQPWTVLRSGQSISTGQTLVSLPGYESLVFLDCGVRLNLWGNLPEFSPSLVRESIVLLNSPPPAIDADLILDRGRVEIGCAPTLPRCTVRLRFLHEVWDVTLAGPGSRVLVELWHQPVEGTAPGTVLRLVVRGRVEIRCRGKELILNTAVQLTWLSWRPDDLQPEKLKQLPQWWEKPPAPSEEVAETLLALKDWAEKPRRLDDSSEGVAEGIRTVIKEPSHERKERLLGLLFLGAIDEIDYLIQFLEDPATGDPGIRTTAMLGLRDWLLRNPSRRGHLVRQVQRHGFANRKANRIVDLLSPVSLQAAEDPQTYQGLIDLLDDDNLALRHLAHWHLYAELGGRMPAAALRIEYDPTWPPARRQQAVTAWRQVLPPGKVPPAPKGGA